MYKLELEFKDIEYILQLLYEQRYKDSAEIIHNISYQVNTQNEETDKKINPDDEPEEDSFEFHRTKDGLPPEEG